MVLINKIKIVYCPEYKEYRGSLFVDAPAMPPLGIAQVTGYLRGHGIKVDQDDLNIKVAYDNFRRKEKIDFSGFKDVKAYEEHLRGNSKNNFDKVVENLIKKSNFVGFDLICLSVPSSNNDMCFRIAISLAKQLKTTYEVPILLSGAFFIVPQNI